MARILSLDACPVSLRNHLVRALRAGDEAVLLPQSERRDDSGVYKNVTFRLSGSEPNVPHAVLSQNWFAGVSAVKVSGRFVDKILNDPKARAEALAKLREVDRSLEPCNPRTVQTTFAACCAGYSLADERPRAAGGAGARLRRSRPRQVRVALRI